MDSLSSEVDKLVADEVNQQAFINGLDHKEQIRLEKLAQLEIQKDNQNQDLIKIRRDLDANKNELKLTKSMVDNLEGFPESIHFLTKQKEWNNKIPLLTDIIYVDEKYRVAIENFLEPFLNYFVVADYPTALQAVDTLIKAQKGKANFFLLSSFENYVPPLLLQLSHQRAIDLIQVDEPYNKLCNYLLEGVYMVEPNQSIAQLPESNLIFLHTNGQFTHREHSLSGGSIGLFEGKKIGRKKNLVFLEESISKKEKEEERVVSIIFQIKNEISAAQALNNQKELSDEKQRLQKIIQQRMSTQSRKDGITQFVEDLRIKMGNTQQQIETASSHLEKIMGSLDIERSLLDKAKEKIALTDGNFRGLAERLSTVSTLFNEKNIQFLRQENKVEGFQRELNNKEKQIIERQNSISQNKIILQKSMQENDYLTANLTKYSDQIQEILTVKSSRQLNITEQNKILNKFSATHL
jgi:chromosome segregation protein